MAMKAERRGRKVGTTVEDYEHVAAVGHVRLKEALVARHNSRMVNLTRFPDKYRHLLLSSLMPIPILDLLLKQYGARQDRPPASYGGEWVDHLAWGVDSAVAAIRLALAGQLAGAALVARHQMERWTNFRAFNTDVRRNDGEGSLSFIARVWGTEVVDHSGLMHNATQSRSFDEVTGAPLADEESAPSNGEPQLDHEHVSVTDGSEICPAAVFGALSDALHSLEGVDALRWDAVQMCQPSAVPIEAYALASAIADAVTLNLRQIRVGLGLLAQERGDLTTAHRLTGVLDRYSRAADDDTPRIEVALSSVRQPTMPREQLPFPTRPVWPELHAVLPLHPSHGLRAEVKEFVEGQADIFDAVIEGRRPAGRLFRDDELVTFAFAWHRWSAVRTAESAISNERELLGEEFDIDFLARREMGYILATEAAGVISGWTTDKPRAAASLAATALRSSYWLWLEDDDRAMGLLRVVLEQTARMRAWRKNPDRASRLDASPKTRPRDWLAAAGWRRLESLNRALGEFAHSRITSRWDGARGLLVDLQFDADPERAVYTARGHCLDVVVALLCRELVGTAKSVSVIVGSCLSDLFAYLGLGGGEVDSYLESLLSHAWSHRKTDFGEPTFSGPAIAWARGTGPSGLHTTRRGKPVEG